MVDNWDYEAFWNEARTQFRDTITSQEYDTWFTNMTYHGSQEGIIELGVPSAFYRDQVAQRFQSALEQTLFQLSARRLKLAYVIRNVAQPEPDAAAPAPRPAAIPVPAAPHLVAPPRRHSQLNPDYTFERLIEGESNSFALNAAIAIAKNPGRAYNPCLVYGGVGLGKTHLLQAIGNSVHAALPDLKVVYVTVETFTNEFIQSIKEKTGHRFKNRYRSADVLLIDDIQFLQGKVETQQELFHTFNALYDANKQMVFSSDRPVSELMNLPDRLINRFERGLNVDLQPPTYETRIAIVTRKIEERGLSLEHGIVELICRNIRSNVRDLEKALTKLAAYTELMQRTITPPIAQRELQEFFAKPEHLSITIDGIQRAVADYFSLTPADLKGKKRTKAIAFPRQVAMYVSRSLTNCSTTEVGLEFGGRDHTTVMHACQRITERIKTDATLEPTLHKIINSLRQKSVA